MMLEKENTLETTVAALLLITSTVVFACIVVDYAVTIAQQTLNTENIPQLGRIRNIESSILNQTDSLFNQTAPEPPGQPLP
jgi:hypothetical protein